MQQQQPLDYESRPKTPPRRRTPPRRIFVRVIVIAWALVPCTFVFALLNSSDQNSMQIEAMIIFLVSPFVAAALTVVYWLHWLEP